MENGITQKFNVHPDGPKGRDTLSIHVPDAHIPEARQILAGINPQQDVYAAMADFQVQGGHLAPVMTVLPPAWERQVG